MATLLEDWNDLMSKGFPRPLVVDFRNRAQLMVGQHYSWLTGHLYDIEGYLGWGPGSREYDGDGYPPKLSWSNWTMRAFCTLLEEIEHDATIADLLKVAMSGDDDSVPVRSLISCLNSRLKYRNSAVQAMYKRIAGARSAYVLGAARIYRYLWEFQGKYAICVAGMVRLLYFPISYSQVSADMRTRRHSTNIIAGQACDVSVTA